MTATMHLRFTFSFILCKFSSQEAVFVEVWAVATAAMISLIEVFAHFFLASCCCLKLVKTAFTLDTLGDLTGKLWMSYSDREAKSPIVWIFLALNS